ncbi:MAG TPA: hypothetical protein VMZ28_04040, partial [Kofleriaceae bacterium]|nr:hypothetical protein [Kofleriaceae bacterium]
MRPVSIGATMLAVLGGAAAPARAQVAPPDWSLQLEGGGEYDSNIHRLELRDGVDDEQGVEGAPLARLGARHRVSVRPSRTQRFTLASTGGLKLFSGDSGQSENAAVVSSDGAYEWNVRGRGALLGLHGSFYDASQVELYDPPPGSASGFSGRTFRTAAGEGSAALLGDSGHRVTALVGYRLFHYKPDPIFDWEGEHYALLYQTSIWRGDPAEDDDAASLDLSAGYRVERRSYDASARTASCADEDAADPLCSAGTNIDRADLNHSVAAESIYSGRRIYSARYELTVNDSNSYGESLVRQRLRLGTTMELLTSLYLTAEATVLLNVYLDPLVVARDEEA